MKYETEYKITSTQKEFIELVVRRHKVKPDTARRRFYDLRKEFGEQEDKRKAIIVEIPSSQTQPPSYLKMLLFKDMVRLKTPITMENLKKHGFNQLEINWMRKHKKI